MKSRSDASARVGRDSGGAVIDRPTVVVDASALAKLFLDEAESPAFRAWRDEQIQAGTRFEAPDLLGYEIAHIVSKVLKVQVPGEDSFAGLVRRTVEGIVLHRAFAEIGDFVGEASAYDASYLAVASAMSSPLVTYDRDLQRAARKHGIKVLAPA